MSYVKENFFKFPIKMYDLYSMINAENQEDKNAKDGNIEPIQVEFVDGLKSCRPENILSWTESYHKGQSMEEVMEDGFPITVVNVSEGLGIAQYECLWNLEEFEKQLDLRMAHIA